MPAASFFIQKIALKFVVSTFLVAPRVDQKYNAVTIPHREEVAFGVAAQFDFTGGGSLLNGRITQKLGFRGTIFSRR